MESYVTLFGVCVFSECPNPDTSSTTDDGGFNITITGSSNVPVTPQDLLTSDNNIFTSNVTIELDTNCDEGVARIMIVEITVENVSMVVVKFLGSDGIVLPDGQENVSAKVFLLFTVKSYC